MSKPLIGLIPQYDADAKRLNNRDNYFAAVSAAGGLPVNLPMSSDLSELKALAERMDAFLFTGGIDVSPARYGEEPLPELGEVQSFRDEMESSLLPLVMEKEKSLLCICRGIQTVNVILGGSLYQDLPSQRPSDICHSQGEPYEKPTHPVRILPGTPLALLLGVEELAVNSMHHQAVKALAPGLQVMATAPDDVIEAAWLPAYPYLRAYQWHPEYLFEGGDEPSRLIFADFINSI